MLRKKKKFFKILSVLVAVIIAFSLFIINTSAETIETSFEDFWTLSTADTKVWILDTDAGGTLTDITDYVYFRNEQEGKSMLVEFNANQNWGVNNVLYFNFVFELNSRYVNPGVSNLKFSLYQNQRNNSNVVFTSTEPNVNTGKVYAPWAYRDGNFNIDSTSKRDYQETHSVPSSNRLGVTYEFNNHNAHYGFKRVCAFAYCTLLDSLSELNYRVYFNIAGLDYRYSTEGEYLNQQIINNQNVNTDKIISNADKNASAIQSNADKNASAIQSNADINASQIQQNQDKNTDKVVNGWEQEKEIDTTVTDDYAVKDKELMDSTEEGRSSAVSVFNSFGSLFQSDGHLYKGLLAVSAVFTEFMKIDWLSSLLNFSLAIGVFAFVIGTGSQIFRSAHEDYKEEKIDKIDSYDERWLM